MIALSCTKVSPISDDDLDDSEVSEGSSGKVRTHLMSPGVS